MLRGKGGNGKNVFGWLEGDRVVGTADRNSTRDRLCEPGAMVIWLNWGVFSLA